MPALFNHTIIASTDRAVSAEFYRSILEADEAPSWGPFTNLTLAGGVMLQFAEPPVEIQMQHMIVFPTRTRTPRGRLWWLTTTARSDAAVPSAT